MADISLRESMKHALPSKSSIGSKRSTKIYEKKEKILNKSQKQALIEKSNRGRKAKETDKYVIESDKKIEEWRKQIKAGIDEKGKKLTNAEKQKLRNRISALQSRVRKKQEIDEPDEINEKVIEFIKIIQEIAKTNEKDNVIDRIKSKQSSQTSAFKQIIKKNSSKDSKSK